MKNRSMSLGRVLVLFSTIVIGCVAITEIDKPYTGPNKPYPGPYPIEFRLIQLNNPLLANELGKLPEFHDDISKSELNALGDLIEIYKENQEAFDRAFDQIYHVGIPEVRKYCSHLQAIFWMAEDGQCETIRTFINMDKIPLNTLIYQAWPSTLDGFKNISNVDKKQRYHLRWNDFSIVSDRLNSPELVDIFINTYITYRGYIRTHGSYSTFKLKRGQCVDAAKLAKYTLKRSGYKTFMRHVKWGGNDLTDNHCGSGIILDNGKYLIVADFNKWGNRVSGPYQTIKEVDNRLARGHGVVEAIWGTFW